MPADKAGFFVCILSGNRTLGQGKESTEEPPWLPRLLPFALASDGPKPLVKEGRRKPSPGPNPPGSALSPGFSSRSEKQFDMCELFRAGKVG